MEASFGAGYDINEDLGSILTTKKQKDVFNKALEFKDKPNSDLVQPFLFTKPTAKKSPMSVRKGPKLTIDRSINNKSVDLVNSTNPSNVNDYM